VRRDRPVRPAAPGRPLGALSSGARRGRHRPAARSRRGRAQGVPRRAAVRRARREPRRGPLLAGPDRREARRQGRGARALSGRAEDQSPEPTVAAGAREAGVTSPNRAAKIAGISGLLTIAIVVFANFAIQDRLMVPGNVAETARNIV